MIWVDLPRAKSSSVVSFAAERIVVVAEDIDGDKDTCWVRTDGIDGKWHIGLSRIETLRRINDALLGKALDEALS